MRTRGIAARRELLRNPGTDGRFEAASPKFTKSVLMPYVMHGTPWPASAPPLAFHLLSDARRLWNLVADGGVVILNSSIVAETIPLTQAQIRSCARRRGRRSANPACNCARVLNTLRCVVELGPNHAQCGAVTCDTRCAHAVGKIRER